MSWVLIPAVNVVSCWPIAVPFSRELLGEQEPPSCDTPLETTCSEDRVAQGYRGPSPCPLVSRWTSSGAPVPPQNPKKIKPPSALSRKQPCLASPPAPSCFPLLPVVIPRARPQRAPCTKTSRSEPGSKELNPTSTGGQHEAGLRGRCSG